MIPKIIHYCWFGGNDFPELVKKCIEAASDVGVAVDEDWKKFWKLRYGKVDFDLESLTVKEGRITELGKEVETSENLDYRYVGICNFFFVPACDGSLAKFFQRFFYEFVITR